MTNILVIGGGAAGMMAALAASGSAASVTLAEQNEKLGKKLFITGKGRCNVTNACEKDGLFKAVNRNSRFLFSAFNQFDNAAVMDFFEKAGLKLKTERGNRVFPESDKSSDVIKALSNELNAKNVLVRLNVKVLEIKKTDEQFSVKLKDKDGRVRNERFDSVIVATGGMSYKSTGSTGDGYKFAEGFGHEIKKTVPSLVALETYDEFPKRVQGLSLKNVTLTVENEKGKKLFSELGEMLFTHFGISGPLVLSASSLFAEAEAKGEIYPKLFIDLKPGMSVEELDNRILRDFSEGINKSFSNILSGLLPSNLVPEIVMLSGIDPCKKVNSVTKEERINLVNLLKRLELRISGLRGFDEAIITKGGINIKEINPATMESKIVPSLYFCGEVLDLDAITGGYNLQIAWSTGYAAGKAAAERKQ